jgi:hypothetical protein
LAWHQEGGWFHRSKSHAAVRHTRWAIHHTSRAVHRLLIVGTGLLVVASCLLAGAAWRLAQGPIDLGWLADRVKAELVDDTAPIRVSFDRLALAWEGFHKGVDYPLDLQISNISITDSAGRRLIAAPEAHLTLSFAGILLGRIVPRTIEVDHGQVSVTRDDTGAIDLGWDLTPDDAHGVGPGRAAPGSRGPGSRGPVDLRQLREQLAGPANSDRGRSRGLLDQLQRAHFRDTEVSLHDRRSGLTARTSGMDVNLVRTTNGHIRGALEAPLLFGNRAGGDQAGGEHAGLSIAVDFVPGSDGSLDFGLTPVRPAGVDALPPALAVLSCLDVPISFKGTVAFDAGFTLRHMQLAARAGTGQVLTSQGAIPLRGGLIDLSGTAELVSINKFHLDLSQLTDPLRQTADLSGTIALVSDRLTASLTVGLEQIDIASLPRLWPVGVGSGARSWVTEHVTGGLVTRATASFVIEADEALHDVILTKGTGELDGSNAAFSWLDNVPPIEQAEVHLRLVDPDTLDIRVSAGRQRIANRGADLLVKDGQMRITGVSLPDQNTTIHTRIDGSVGSALALLGEPRLHLLSEHPINLKSSGGEVSVTLDLQFPLKTDLPVDDIQIHADAHLRRVKLLDIAGGHVLEDGAFDLGITKEGLSVKGRGLLAAMPVTLDGTMDFSPGPADQVVQRLVVSGRPDASQLDAAGLPLKHVVGGPIPMTAVVIERRNGDGSVQVDGDLTEAALEVSPLAWSKPSGVNASATAALITSHGRLTKIDRIAVRGVGLLLSGSANLADGRLRSVRVDSFQLGRSQGHGLINIAANDDINIVVQGDQIDLSPKLKQKSSAANVSDGPSATRPVWALNARFDRAILANEEIASGLLANATGAGDAIRLLDAVGATQAGAGFAIKIEPSAGGRHLLVEAKDAGRFLRGLDAVRVMQGGHLTVDAMFDSPSGFQPLAGKALLNDFIVKDSPLFGKLLQAITLYGLVDVLRGPGMTFSTAVVPFRYDGTNLNLNEVRAENPSLGLTAQGRIGLSSGQAAITGTIVPAYFFNSLPGQLPLVGKLFSPEKGGGVFAARFGIDGLIDDPSITINAASALTPGFLREIFGVFDRPASAAPPSR